MKPALKWYVTIVLQCHHHFLTGPILYDELQEFVQENTRMISYKNKIIIHKQSFMLAMPASVSYSISKNRVQHYCLVCVLNIDAGIIKYNIRKGLIPQLHITAYFCNFLRRLLFSKNRLMPALLFINQHWNWFHHCL